MTAALTARQASGRRLASELALVCALAVAFQLPIFDRWFSFMDEGHILLFADLVAKGGEMYRDATVYPLPGAFYFLAWMFRLFEPSNLVARWIVLVEFTAFVALCFAWLRSLVPAAWAWAGVVLLLAYRVWAFPHWHMYSYSTTALLVLLASLAALLRGLETGRRAWILAAGLLYGVGVFCKQDYGAAVLLAVVATLALHARTDRRAGAPGFWRLAAWFLVPSAAVGAAAGLHFLREGILGDVVRLTVLNHFVGMASFEYPRFPPLFPLFGQDPVIRSVAGRGEWFPAIVFTLDLNHLMQSALYRDTSVLDLAVKLYHHAQIPLVAAGALRLWHRRGAWAGPERALCLREFGLWALGAALVLLVSLNRPQDYVHLTVLYWPQLLLGVVWAHALAAWRPRPLRIVAAVAALPALLALAYTGELWWELHARHSAPLASARAGIRVTPDQAAFLDAAVDYIQSRTQPGETVALVPYFPLLHFYADRPGPDRTGYIVWPFPELPNRDRRVIEGMEATHTRVVLYNVNQFHVFPDLGEYAPELFDYLMDHFEFDRIISQGSWGYDLIALRRREEPEQGVPVPDAASLGDVALEREGEPPVPVDPSVRPDWLRLESWPFRRTLALRPIDAGHTVVSLPLQVPARSRLETAISVAPRLWSNDGTLRIEFEIAVAEGDRRETVFAQALRPAAGAEDKGWTEVAIPLDRWAGRQVRIELAAESTQPDAEPRRAAGFALPRLVVGTREQAAP